MQKEPVTKGHTSPLVTGSSKKQSYFDYSFLNSKYGSKNKKVSIFSHVCGKILWRDKERGTTLCRPPLYERMLLS